MRAYVIASGVRIAPFDELARDLPVGNEPLARLQARLFARFGLEVVEVSSLDAVPRDEDRIVTYDNVYFTRRVLKSFLARWRAAGRPSARLALPLDSTFIRTFSALQDFERAPPFALFNLWALPAGAPAGGEVRPLEVIYRERVIEVPLPERVIGVPSWVHPVTTSVCLHVRHWIHLLQANRLAIQVRWVDEVVQRPWWGAWILAKALFGRGKPLWRVLGAANHFGRGVDVHPTARVEGSFLGDGARVGAQALVRGCIVGPGAVLEERVNAAYSVIGPKSFISKYTLLYTSAIMAEANVGASVQMCLVGRRAALTPRATPIDVVPGAKLKVRDGDRLVEVDLPVLGSCFGHDTFIGADVYVAPGRAIPNGARIGPLPERVLAMVPEHVEPGRTYVVRGGRLEPL